MYISATIIAIIAVFTVLTFNYAKTLKHILCGFIGIILTLYTLACLIVVPFYTVADDNKHVATISGKSIYYDNSSDKYFVIKTNNWNPTKIYYRIYLDTEEAEKIIDVSKIVNEWDKEI